MTESSPDASADAESDVPASLRRALWRLPRSGAGEPRRLPDVAPPSIFGYVFLQSGWAQAALLVLALATAALATAPLELQRRIVNEAIDSGDAALLLTLGAIFVSVLIAQKVVKFIFSLYRGLVSEDVLRGARRRIYTKDVAPRAQTAGRAQATAILGEELQNLAGFVGTALSDLMVNLATVLFILGYMLFVEPVLVLAGIVIFALQVAFIPAIQRRLDALTAERTRLRRALNAEIVELAAPETVAQRLDRIRNVRASAHVWKNLGKSLVNLANHLGSAVALILGGWLVITGQTSLGTVVAFVSGFERIVDPARSLIANYQTIRRAAVEYKMINDWKTTMRDDDAEDGRAGAAPRGGD